MKEQSLKDNGIISREQSVALKAIAILAVIIAHACGSAKSFTNVPILKDGIVTSIFCQGGMCLFLILSGYGLLSSFINKGLGNYWDRKFDKIFFPAIVVQLFYVVVKTIFIYYIYGTFEVSRNTIFGDILCSNQINAIDGSIWFLSYLLYCYIIFYVVFKYIKDIKLALGLFGIYWIITMPICTVLWENGFYCVSSFAIGVFLSYWTNLKQRNVSMALKIVCIVIFSLAGGIYYFFFRQNWLWDNIVSNLVAFDFIILISLVNVKKLKPLTFIGVHSFSLYLLQGKVIFGIFPYQNYSDNVRLIAFLILFALNLFLAVVFDKIKDSMNNAVKIIC